MDLTISAYGYQFDSTAVVEQGCVIGLRTKIWHFAHIRSTARIGVDCVIGKDVYIDADVVIGDRVKIQNGVSVYRGVTIEDDVFVGPHAVFTNDLTPRASGEYWTLAKTIVRRGASIGANATIVGDVELGEWSMVAAGAVVTKNVGAHRLVMGCPASVRGKVCQCGNRLESVGELVEVEVEPGGFITLPLLSACYRCGRRYDREMQEIQK